MNNDMERKGLKFRIQKMRGQQRKHYISIGKSQCYMIRRTYREACKANHWLPSKRQEQAYVDRFYIDGERLCDILMEIRKTYDLHYGIDQKAKKLQDWADLAAKFRLSNVTNIKITIKTK